MVVDVREMKNSSVCMVISEKFLGLGMHWRWGVGWWQIPAVG